MSESAFIQLDKVSHFFPTNKGGERLNVLADIDVTIPKGIVTSIVGPSGCGKSTLLRILAGLISPSAGNVRIDGRTPARYREDQGIGFVFQKPVLFPWRNVSENVTLPFEISPLVTTGGKDAVVENVNELLDQLGLSGFADAYPGELSGGMLQRAALARALALQPGLLFLDEPLSAIDELTREELWIAFRELWQMRGLSVVLVTHSLQEAVFLGDRVIVLSNRPGHILSVIDNDFSCARDKSLLSNLAFHSQCEEVRHILRTGA